MRRAYFAVNAHCIYFFCTLHSMRDARADRLKDARKAAGFRRAVEAAESLGVEYPTYASHENGSRTFDIDAAVHYARRYRVSLDWLLDGKGEAPRADGANPESVLRSALLAYGVPSKHLDRIVGMADGFANAFSEELSERSPGDGQPEPASPRREAKPSRSKSRQLSS
jgi:transcriptional regulator with XRE-family HTH domain